MALRRVLPVGAFVILPLFLLSYLFVDGHREGLLAVDFVNAFLEGAEAITRGESPYPQLDDPRFLGGLAYVYPPLVAIVTIPFTVLPVAAAEAAFIALLASAVVATLWVLDVRDWRCYGAAFLWGPVVAGLLSGNITLLLGLGAALAWRFRDGRGGAVANGVTLAAKLFFWPLLLWLAATGRRAALAWSLVVAATVTVVTWGALGFVDIERYPGLLRALSELEAPAGYTPYALSLDLGVGEGPARVISIVVAASLLGAVVALARAGDDRRAFVVAVAASLACAPIVWLHYFAVLLVPVALTSKRLSVVWFIPMLLWAGSGTFNGEPWQTALVLGVAALVVAACLRPTRRERRPDSPVPVGLRTLARHDV